MLVIIGRRWLEIADTSGRRRLEDPDDFVRIEIEMALSRGVTIIPALVQNAPMPRVTDIPPSISDLVYRQSVEIRPDPHFHRDMDQLIDRLTPIMQAGNPYQQAVMTPVATSSAGAPRMPVSLPRKRSRMRFLLPFSLIALGVLLGILAEVAHFTSAISTGIPHFSTYVVILGAALFVLGVIWAIIAIATYFL
jgi:hypothetical protein